MGEGEGGGRGVGGRGVIYHLTFLGSEREGEKLVFVWSSPARQKHKGGRAGHLFISAGHESTLQTFLKEQRHETANFKQTGSVVGKLVARLLLAAL